MGDSSRIDSALCGDGPSISFEFFPPRSESALAQFQRTLDELRPARPTFVSVTYGAGGSTRDLTVDLVSQIQRTHGIRAMAHLTCLAHRADEIDAVLERLWASGVRNVLALRGDAPGGPGAFAAAEADFRYASELVYHIRRRSYDLCLGVAGYPETHPQAQSPEDDLLNLRRKVDAGAQFVITQLFFDNADFYRWRDAARRLGITVPLIAGIMPILNVGQVKRFTALCSARIPPELLKRIEGVEGDHEAVRAAGVEHTLAQCRDLLAHGVDGLHFYTLNRSASALEVLRAIR